MNKKSVLILGLIAGLLPVLFPERLRAENAAPPLEPKTQQKTVTPEDLSSKTPIRKGREEAIANALAVFLGQSIEQRMESEITRLKKEAALLSLPTDRKEFEAFYFLGNTPGTEDATSFYEAMRTLEKRSLPQDLPAPITAMTSARKEKRNAFLSEVAEPLKRINELLPGCGSYRPRLETGDALVAQMAEHYGQARLLGWIYWMRIQKQLDEQDFAGAKDAFLRSQELYNLYDGSLIGAMCATAFANVRMDTLEEMFAMGLRGNALVEIHLALEQEEILFRTLWNRAWRAEAAATMELCDMASGAVIPGFATTEEESGDSPANARDPQAPKSPDESLIRIRALQDKILVMKWFLKMIPEIDEMRVYAELKPPENGMTSDVVFVRNFHLAHAPSLKYEFLGLARIRAARVAVLRLIGKNSDGLEDPFSGKPYLSRKGKLGRPDFMETTFTGEVDRIYSVGPDGKDGGGEFLRMAAPGYDEIGFDVFSLETP